MFERGETALLVTRAPGGRELTEQVKIKEMAGQRNAAVSTKQGDRIVNTKQLRKLHVVPAPAAKVVTPPSFAPAAPATDPKDISIVLRGARTSRNLTIEFMAQLLRVEVGELAGFESSREIPSDDVCLRLADVLSLPLDPIIAAVEYSRAKERKRAAELAEADRVAAERKAQAEREEAARKQAEQARAQNFELFTTALMKLVPLPTTPNQREQWRVFAQALFDLKPSELS